MSDDREEQPAVSGAVWFYVILASCLWIVGLAFIFSCHGSLSCR